MRVATHRDRTVALALRSVVFAIAIAALYVLVITRGEVLHRIGGGL